MAQANTKNIILVDRVRHPNNSIISGLKSATKINIIQLAYSFHNPNKTLTDVCQCGRRYVYILRPLPLWTNLLCRMSNRDGGVSHIAWSGDPSITSTAGRLGRTLADRMKSSIDWAERPHMLVATIMLSAKRNEQGGACAKGRTR